MLTILKEHSRCRRGESTQELASLQEGDADIGGKRAGKSFLKILRKHERDERVPSSRRINDRREC